MVQQDMEFEDENLQIDINKHGIEPEGEYTQ
jgi:hypothetical protein